MLNRIWHGNHVRLRKFFRKRLLALSNEAIVELIEQFDKEVRAYKDEAIRMSWYMRGGLSYDDAMQLGQVDRELVSKLIKDNLETTKKSKMPFF